MSTKIYNAYHFKGTINELMPFLFNLKERFKIELEKHILSDYKIELFKREFEKLHLSKDDWYSFVYVLEQAKYKEGKVKCEFFDYNSDVVVYFHAGEVYLQFFIGWQFRELKEYIKIRELDKLKDYHYQNQTDPYYAIDFEEGKITEDKMKALEIEWEERRKNWDEILGDEDDIASSRGLLFDLYPKELILKTIVKLFNEKKIIL
jgi:hypothetical protein